jgi:molybdate transport system ATP-binding protein
MSDRMIVLEKGKKVQDGVPEKIFTQKKISGKFQFTGELLAIEKQDIIYVLTLLIGTEIVKVVADPTEVQGLQIGDKILTSSKAFNPIIQKLP